jgi:hypothetical protein
MTLAAGQPHIELVTENGLVRAYTAPDDVIIPKNQWVNLVIACFPSQVKAANSNMIDYRYFGQSSS